MEFSLLWAALTAVAFGWVGLRLWVDNESDRAGDRLIAAVLVGLLAGRLVAMIGQGVNPVTSPGELIVVRGGVDTAGAALGFLATLIWSTRGDHRALDAMAPAVLLGLAGWHAGCLWRNACLGAPSELPWAWAQDGSLVTRHPVELYAAVGLAVAALIVSRLGWRPWLRSGVALSLAAGIRLLTEPLRPDLGLGPATWYGVGLAGGVLLALIGPYLARERPAAPT